MCGLNGHPLARHTDGGQAWTVLRASTHERRAALAGRPALRPALEAATQIENFKFQIPSVAASKPLVSALVGAEPAVARKAKP